MSEPARPEVRQEAKDIRGKWIVVIGVVVVVIGGLAVGAEALMLYGKRGAMHDRTARPIRAPDRDASPIEHTRIERTARGLVAQRQARNRLDSYGWVNEREGIVHIPIEAAMRWMVHDQKEALDAMGPAVGGTGAAARSRPVETGERERASNVDGGKNSEGAP